MYPVGKTEFIKTEKLEICSLAQHNGAMAANAEQIDESLKRQALAEEEAAMDQYKKSTNPFLSSPTAAAPSAPGFKLKLAFQLALECI